MARLGKCSREKKSLFAFVGTSRCASHEDGEGIGRRMVSSQFSCLVIVLPSILARAIQGGAKITFDVLSRDERTGHVQAAIKRLN
jgi:hypothetical protein